LLALLELKQHPGSFSSKDPPIWPSAWIYSARCTAVLAGASRGRLVSR
jgi:hypothetical protein